MRREVNRVVMPAELDIFEAIVRCRRSVRAFLPQPVDRGLIERVILAAGTAPSSCNTQPWKLHIVSRPLLTRLGDALIAAALDGTPRTPEVEQAQPYCGAYRDRQVDAAMRLFTAQGVARHDKQGRLASLLRNYAFFDAPHAAFLFLPPQGGIREAADCGKFAQTFMLAAAAAGLGSCPQGSLGDYPGIVRDIVGLDEPGRLLLGLSFGYPDDRDPSATVRPPRVRIEDLASFH